MQTLAKLTDDQLVQSYAKGNPEAFDVLLQRHQSKLLNYITQHCNNAQLAEDIFQETFVKAIMTLKQGGYTESGKFSAWLIRIAHNLVIDSFRHEKWENMLSTVSDESDPLNRRELAEGNIEDFMIDDQIKKDVRKIVMSLPDAQREVLVMRFYRNMSFKEIADATSVSINTALGRMRYGLINMRRIAAENNIALVTT